ncbi:unnamed protein product [Ilex paraguariensis]|uniref:GPI-anchored protein LLG1-like domain-containing protein n=1 Tax=Ilex paraguariensis TaxID=185542 RepID=A0ABC8RVD0_9AQUA
MEWNFCFSFSTPHVMILCLSLFLFTSFYAAPASSAFISDGIFGSDASTGRNLLQAKTACPVNFEFQNYTIITSQCRGPHYLPQPCCDAFKEFACPFADELNDLSNDCASTMFSYINIYGKYPPGLFSSECQEGKQGLACPALSPTESANDSGSHKISNTSPLLMLTGGLLVLLWWLF